MVRSLNRPTKQKVSDRTLRKIATDFRQGVLAGAQSASMCFAVSAPLEGLLNATGIPCTLVEGGVGEENHYWIKLHDGRILDPTADQFMTPTGESMPTVFLGPKPAWYGATPIRAAIARRQALLAKRQ